MTFKRLFLILFLISFFSCKKIDLKQESVTTIDTTQIDMLKVSSKITRLNPKAVKLVKDWIEYQNMDEFIQQYYHISKSDALLNAKELSKLSQQLKDSIRVEILDIPSVKIRLNVLNNEVLRLADMATITHISTTDIRQENRNILDAYFALNLKINNMVRREKLNSDVNAFIEEIINTGDSTTVKKEVKIDSTQLK